MIVKEVQLVAGTALRVGLPQQFTGSVNVVVPDAVHDLIGSEPVDVVVVADGMRPVARRRQLPPVLPGQSPGAEVPDVVVAGGIARAVVGIASREAVPVLRAADGGQQVDPVGVSVLRAALPENRENTTLFLPLFPLFSVASA